MVEERENEAPIAARSADEWLLHAQELLPLALEKAREVKAFPSRWKTIISKLEQVPSCLLDLSSHPCFSKNALCKEQLQGVSATLRESMELAECCLREKHEGKLKMQSDLDLLTGKLDLNLKDCRVLVKTGVLGEATLPLSINKSSDSEVHTGIKELLARLQIGHLEAKHRALDALLGIMKEDEKNLIAVIGRSNVAALVNLLTATTSPLIREKVVTIICCLIESGSCENWLITEGVLPSLIRLVESGSPTSKEKAVISLQKLSGSPEAAHSIAEHGGTRPLIELCAHRGLTLQSSAACTLKNISAVPEARQILAQEGLIEAMIDLLENGASFGPKECAAQCLQNITSSNENLRRSVISKGGIRALLAYINNSLLPLEPAVGAVRNLVGTVSLEGLVSAGLLPCLVHVIRFGALGAQQAATSAICRVCGNDDAKKLIGEAGIIPLLINSLELKSDTLREVSAQAISSLITVHQNYREVKRNDKSVPNLVQQLDPNPRNTAKKYAVSCLLCLSSSKKCRKVMVSYGAIGYLKKLTEMDVPGSKKLLERLERGKFWSLFSKS
ncbi:uncharacterized protein LOC116202216 [Punica granatum]|uniref:DUF7032 domain-containing protein n=2 Tax=Punica granatum TaxID=22663 RepID=A0A218XVD9_PUNGR|nr:uncharacterized protein LOC116202216 [Punica granatum]XP_031389526.1 uncharacterized protein LOC116202216 [Punica granatum]XP_031389527.1 uncharacterized protein LOC116202216 [Punica granatum]OWM88242.1 hypothetical protein CDL15_Pgr003654 [Punica granatum]PKI45389.1 hypothetical protein CRG98_034194 [Punica granatum]